MLLNCQKKKGKKGEKTPIQEEPAVESFDMDGTVCKLVVEIGTMVFKSVSKILLLICII